jgi:hypothetical protein
MVKEKTNNDKSITQIQQVEENAVAASKVGQDVKNSILVVSVLLNLIVFTFWLTLQVTTRYNEELSKFIFG